MRKVMTIALTLSFIMGLFAGCARVETASLSDSLNSQGGYVFEGMKLWGLEREAVLSKMNLSTNDVEPVLLPYGNIEEAFVRDEGFRLKNTRSFDGINGQWEVYFMFEDDVMVVGRYLQVCESENELAIVCGQLADILISWPTFPKYEGDDRFPKSNIDNEAESLRGIARGNTVGAQRVHADGTFLWIAARPHEKFAISITVYSREPGPR